MRKGSNPGTCNPGPIFPDANLGCKVLIEFNTHLLIFGSFRLQTGIVGAAKIEIAI
jgi:hypothetical protein